MVKMVGSKNLYRVILPYGNKIEETPFFPGLSFIPALSFSSQPMYTLVQPDTRGDWLVSSPGHVSDLKDGYPSAYVGTPETTYRFMVIMRGRSSFIPRRVYNTLVALAGLESREVWLVKTEDLTPWASKGVNEHQVYVISETSKGDHTYLEFEDHQDGSGIEVHFSEAPEEVSIIPEEPIEAPAHKINDIVHLADSGHNAVVLAVYPNFEGNARTYYALKMSHSAREAGLKAIEIVEETLVEPDAVMPPERPYTCSSCQKRLTFPETFFHQGRAFCSDHAPDLSKDSQGW